MEAKMTIARSEAESLFKAGEFSELLQRCDVTPSIARAIEPETRVILAHALALSGTSDLAGELAAFDAHPSSSLIVRARAAAVLGLVYETKGDINAAIRQSQLGVR